MSTVRRRLISGITLVSCIGATLVVALVAPSASAAPPASYTTVNVDYDLANHCKNGSGTVNCNIYDGKEFVWMNGGPDNALLADGSYFFAVLAPGGQSDPKDANPLNLSAVNDTYAARTFTVASGVLSTSGGHTLDRNMLRLAPYADTPNSGGEYILAICSLAGGYANVTPNDCKYDAFKVRAGTTPPGLFADLAAIKTANTSYTNTYSWSVTKDVDKTIVKQVGGNATFTYTVNWTKSGPVASNWAVSGVVSVFNTGDAQATGVSVSDSLPGAICTMAPGGATTIDVNAAADYPYTCTFANAPATTGVNTANVSWTGEGAGGSTVAIIAYDFGTATITTVNDCADVNDTLAGSLGNQCASGGTTYPRTVPVPAFGCTTVTNTATVLTSSDSETVQACGPVQTGALTIGFWQNKNGQAIITGGAATLNVCNSATYLRGFAPFQDLSATATCAQVGTYVTNIIKAANASGAAMNAMLKAQMLATALDVYFSDPALGGNKIGSNVAIGGVAIDLTKVCSDIAACSNYINASPAFGGATSMTVSAALAYAASQSNAGGSAWYGQVKATQELAKDVFDAINNRVIFGA